MVVALVALSSSLVGGAAAATLITGADIKNGSITDKDIRKNAVRTKHVTNGTLLSNDFKAGQLPAGATGPRGVPGANGEKGDPCLPTTPACVGPKGDPGTNGTNGTAGTNGTNGTNGASVFASSIPSGTTLTGIIHRKHDCTVQCRFDESFVVPAASPPTSANFASDGSGATTDDDVACLGTHSNPTAPPGKVCIYLEGQENASTMTGDLVAVGGTRRGFMVNVAPFTAGAATLVSASWAFTAP
jgi:hypothetical protein